MGSFVWKHAGWLAVLVLGTVAAIGYPALRAARVAARRASIT